MFGEIIEFFIITETNKEASTVLCSVVKHLGSGRALKKWRKTLDCVSCFPLHFFRALPLPACFTTEQSTVEASLFVNYDTVVIKSKKHPSISEQPSPRQKRELSKFEIGTGPPSHPTTPQGHYEPIYCEAINLMVNAIGERCSIAVYHYIMTNYHL